MATTRQRKNCECHANGGLDVLNEICKFFAFVLESTRKLISKRGIKTFTGLGQLYRQLDSDSSGLLLQCDLEQGLLRFHIDLPSQVSIVLQAQLNR